MTEFAYKILMLVPLVVCLIVGIKKFVNRSNNSTIYDMEVKKLYSYHDFYLGKRIISHAPTFEHYDIKKLEDMHLSDLKKELLLTIQDQVLDFECVPSGYLESKYKWIKHFIQIKENE